MRSTEKGIPRVISEDKASVENQSARNIGISLALQLLMQAIVAVMADMAPDSDIWRLKLSSTLKNEILRSTVENARKEFLDAMTQSANDTIDFIVFGRDSDVAH
jgi:hypothetical protein